jgi:hypothetical protein
MTKDFDQADLAWDELKSGNLFDDPENSSEFVDLSLPDQTFKNLLNVEQDYSQFLDLKASPKVDGLFSSGFASCAAIIMKSHNKQRLTLTHLTDILTPEQVKKHQMNDPSFDHPFAEEAKFVSYNFKKSYDIEIGISFKGYTQMYLQEIKRNRQSLPPLEFFMKQIPAYQTAVRDFLQKEINLIHLLDKSMILVDRNGTVHTFSQYNEHDIHITASIIEDPSRLELKPVQPKSEENLSCNPHIILAPPSSKSIEIENPTQFSCT